MTWLPTNNLPYPIKTGPPSLTVFSGPENKYDRRPPPSISLKSPNSGIGVSKLAIPAATKPTPPTIKEAPRKELDPKVNTPKAIKTTPVTIAKISLKSAPSTTGTISILSKSL